MMTSIGQKEFNTNAWDVQSVDVNTQCFLWQFQIYTLLSAFDGSTGVEGSPWRLITAHTTGRGILHMGIPHQK